MFSNQRIKILGSRGKVSKGINRWRIKIQQVKPGRRVLQLCLSGAIFSTLQYTYLLLDSYLVSPCGLEDTSWPTCFSGNCFLLYISLNAGFKVPLFCESVKFLAGE